MLTSPKHQANTIKVKQTNKQVVISLIYSTWKKFRKNFQFPKNNIFCQKKISQTKTFRTFPLCTNRHPLVRSSVSYLKVWMKKKLEIYSKKKFFFWLLFWLPVFICLTQQRVLYIWQFVMFFKGTLTKLEITMIKTCVDIVRTDKVRTHFRTCFKVLTFMIFANCYLRLCFKISHQRM